MSKQIKDYLHLYLGCKALYFNKGFSYEPKEVVIFGYDLSKENKCVVHTGGANDNPSWFKPLLRPISDMNSEEADYFAWLCMDSRHHLEEETRLTQEEIQTELVKNDNGNMLDDNVEIYIDLTARCFEGAVVIKKDGSITVYDSDNDKYDSVDDVAFKIHFLLSKHFDLFGLIEAGLAIDKTTLNQTT